MNRRDFPFRLRISTILIIGRFDVRAMCERHDDGPFSYKIRKKEAAGRTTVLAGITMKKRKHITRGFSRIMGVMLIALMLASQAFAMEVPISQTEEMVNGRQTLVKVFEVPADTNPETLIETDLSQNGYDYEMSSIVKDVVTKSDKKNISQEQSVVCNTSKEDDARIEALKSLPAFIDYNEDGYTGKLYPLVNTLELEETGRTPHSGTNTITKSYTVDYNDESLVPSTVTSGGKTYTKSRVTFSDGSYSADGTIPDNYVATVTYSKGYSYTTVDGYKATMLYSGDVEYEADDTIQYTITYYGTPSQGSGHIFTTASGTPSLISWMLIIIAIAAAVVLILFIVRSRGGSASLPSLPNSKKKRD